MFNIISNLIVCWGNMQMLANTSTTENLPITYNSFYEFAMGEGYFNKANCGVSGLTLSSITLHNPNNEKLFTHYILIGS